MPVEHALSGKGAGHFEILNAKGSMKYHWAWMGAKHLSVHKGAASASRAKVVPDGRVREGRRAGPDLASPLSEPDLFPMSFYAVAECKDFPAQT